MARDLTIASLLRNPTPPRSSIVNLPGESTLRRDFLRLQLANKERSEAIKRQQLQEQQQRENEEHKRQLLAERQKRIEEQREQRQRLEEVMAFAGEQSDSW